MGHGHGGTKGKGTRDAKRILIDRGRQQCAYEEGEGHNHDSANTHRRCVGE